MLFILGNVATSAQVTGVTLIDTTSMPTIMPTKTPSGEILSAEVQEELKAIVQSYIEIRYRALSVSDSEDYKQNGFGDRVSDAREAEVFVREETAKLAVQIKHAELDDLRYVSYKVFLNFRSVTIDPSTQVATISVIEGNEVVYEISTELNPENPIVSHTAGIKHTISEPVSGVDVTDFGLTTTGGISGVSIASVSGSDTTYTVVAKTGKGSGTLQLVVSDNDSIVDGAGNKLGGTGLGNGNYWDGETYTVRPTAFMEGPVSHWILYMLMASIIVPSVGGTHGHPSPH